MATDTGKPTLLMRFCDSFLQERNIKWLLGLGMAILLGSSLLLVSMHWHDCTAAWKYLIFLGHIGAIHGAGYWCYHRLGLRRTGTVLQGLTVLLIPIAFHTLSLGMDVVPIVLLAATLTFSVLAARNIFDHFLRGPQPTFLLSYLMLALAGAVLPTLPFSWAPMLSLFLWAVFAAGAVKVNRHVFWLTEEQRAPRIFGFFPILLLGAQFLGLFFLHGAAHVELPWLGLGCVLMAIPVLLAADALAGVFQQRTGDLVRPWPWSIMLPMCVGLALCAGGVNLAALGLVPPARAHAPVIAAALAAVVMALVARRTRKEAFVWAMLAGIMLAYNFSPLLFRELARTVVHQGAFAVKEQALPFAFYGLTYLPLILSLMGASVLAARRWHSELFARPLRRFVVGLSVLLLAASLGHIKAIFPVGLCSLAVFTLQTILFRDWRPAAAAIVAWILTAYGLAPFANQVLDVALPDSTQLVCLLFAAGILLPLGAKIDPWLRGLSSEVAAWRQFLVQTASLAVSLGLAVFWSVNTILGPQDPTRTDVLLVVLLVVQSLWWMKPLVNGFTILFVQGFAVHLASRWHTPLLPLMTLIFLGQWLATYLFALFPTARISRTFAAVNYPICMTELGLVWLGFVFPSFLFDLAQPFVQVSMTGWLEIGWPLQWLMLIWAFDVARREACAPMTFLACLGFLGLAGAALLHLAGPDAWIWLPALWAGLALASFPVLEMLQRILQSLCAEGNRPDDVARLTALSMPIECVILAVLCLVEVASLVTFPWSMRVAGALGLVGLIAFAVRHRQTQYSALFAIFVNLQVLCLVVHLCCGPVNALFDLVHADLAPLWLPLAAVSAVSLFLWQFARPTQSTILDAAVTGQHYLLRGLIVLGLLQSLTFSNLQAAEVCLAAGSFLLLAVGEIMTAVKWQRHAHAWLAEAILLAGVGYLFYFRVFVLGHGVSMFILLALGVCLWIVREIVVQRPRWQVLALPLQATALILPGITVAVGIGRHFLAHEPSWKGANSLALLLAAGFYFWRGVEERKKRFLLLAGLVVNIALALLWRELTWTDPQFFMIPIGMSFLGLVQLLREEIPVTFHDPLRYAGVLTILVSPTFHIVLSGSWVHVFCLMVASVAVVLLAIGLRVRVLMYVGTGFLLADLAAMIVLGSYGNPNVLWMAGLALGGAVLTLAAICERNREDILRRMHLLSETLKHWE